MSDTKAVKASQHESYGAFTIISILLPVVGVILGIVYLAKDNKLDKKLGEHCIAIGVLFSIIFSGFYYYWLGTQTATILTNPYTTPSTASNYLDDYQQQQSNAKDAVTIKNTSVKDQGYGIYQVVGEATNGNSTAKTFTLKATFYDSAGKILGTATGALDNVSAGETKTFNLVSTDKIAGYANYKVQIDSIF